MITRRDLNGALALLLALSLACSPAHALVSLNDSHDHLYVTGTVAMGWDSNVYANADARSDYTLNTTIVAEYTRRAGWIGVNGSVSVESARYNNLTTENYNNPKFSLELTKQTGRTTGSVTFHAARQSRADAAVNMRSESWNYDAGLNFRYPIVGIYTLSGQVGYALVKYTGNSIFPDLSTVTASADLIRLFSSERDVMIGYRYRHSETSVSSSYDDHAFTVGMTGKLIRGINGGLRAGYQVRVPQGFVLGGREEQKFSAWTASASATYALNKRATFTGSLSKDFSTTATDASVDSTTASLDLQYAYSSHWSLNATASAGDSRFLGDAGRLVISFGPPPILGPSRHDNFASASASVGYSLNEHLKASASYTWFKNWSTSPFADFVRTGYNLNLSSRW